jgi:ATP-dependent Zn protease
VTITEDTRKSGVRRRQAHHTRLARDWRVLGRLMTGLAVLASPLPFLLFSDRLHYKLWWALAATFGVTVAARGLLDVIASKVLPRPSMLGADDRTARYDTVARRRLWFWRAMWRRAIMIAIVLAILSGAIAMISTWSAGIGEPGVAFLDGPGKIWHLITRIIPSLGQSALYLPVLLFINVIVLMGPLVVFNLLQVKGYEPGDANWGVKLDDVRGQAEAKQEVNRVVTLWQSGEEFERLGGKRERGLLFLGSPGTGKTMLAKAIATNFNSPFVSIPGSGFAATFMGIDVLIVRYVAWKARRLARKWGGQCIVFIDEIDAIGLRRQSLGAGFDAGSRAPSSQIGSASLDGELVYETAAWRERVFDARRSPRPEPPAYVRRLDGIARVVFPGMGGQNGGSNVLNQLLIVMDGIGDPPLSRRIVVNRVNTILDAVYVVPARIGRAALRLRRPRTRSEQIYFIGACNVPISSLDPALTRPGRMGRHIWFRTPTHKDRKDILDLYINKVSHEPDLDSPKRREEIARVTSGYSPAMIDQLCSHALTLAQDDGRDRFAWEDIVEAMSTIESGAAINLDYIDSESRAIAIHEAGHAICAHLYMRGAESTRITIRPRSDGSLGHHRIREKDERFSKWRHEEIAELVWALGAMGAERVVYGENSIGVGGDVASATYQAAMMVGTHAMTPVHVELPDPGEDESASELRARVMKHFEEIGLSIMRRADGGGMEGNPISATLSDPYKRKAAAQILGQAYMVSYHTALVNKPAVERVADMLVERRELNGDEVIDLLSSCGLRRPEIDFASEDAWPTT